MYVCVCVCYLEKFILSFFVNSTFKFINNWYTEIPRYPWGKRSRACRGYRNPCESLKSNKNIGDVIIIWHMKSGRCFLMRIIESADVKANVEGWIDSIFQYDIFLKMIIFQRIRAGFYHAFISFLFPIMCKRSSGRCDFLKNVSRIYSAFEYVPNDFCSVCASSLRERLSSQLSLISIDSEPIITSNWSYFSP